MPGFDGTGPQGMGAMTGRGAGRCAGAAGQQFGARGFGRGCGRGGNFGAGRGGGWGGGQRFACAAAPDAAQQRALLQQQVELAESQLKALRTQLDSLADGKSE